MEFTVEKISKKTDGNERKTVLITGASKGLGRELAIVCARRNMDLILTSLPHSNIDSLAEQIRNHFSVSVRTYVCDLTDDTEVFKLAAFAGETPIHMLINNVGCGGSGTFEHSSTDLLETVLKLNIRIPTLLTRLLIPALQNVEGRSYVMNISSIAAFSPIGYKHAYPASKAFLLSFTRGLKEEFRETGISFSSVHPGPMLTTSDSCKRIIHQGARGSFAVIKTSTIAEIAFRKTISGKAVIVPGFGNKCFYWGIRILPEFYVPRLLTRMVKKGITARV